MVSTTAPKKTPARTFEYQDKLPRLPVPDLDKSLEGYIKSIVPLLEQKVCLWGVVCAADALTRAVWLARPPQGA